MKKSPLKLSSAMFNEKDDQRLATTFHHRLYESALVLVSGFSLFLLLSLLSYHVRDPGWSHTAMQSYIANWEGRSGALVADFLLYFFGISAYCVPLLLCRMVWELYRRSRLKMDQFGILMCRVAGFIMILCATCGLVDGWLPLSHLPSSSGGVLGHGLEGAMRGSFGEMGGFLGLLSLWLMGLSLLTSLRWSQLIPKIRSWFVRQCTSGARQNSLPEHFLEPKPSFSPSTRVSTPLEVRSHVDRIAVPSAIVTDTNPVAQTCPPLQKPPITLLDAVVERPKKANHQQYLYRMARDVELRLKDFGVIVKVVAAYPGPVVTRFELALQAGTKVSKISTLAKDLARSLSVVSVRVVEIIPGKSVIGLELPNPHRETVRLRDTLASQAYRHAHSPLTLALGKDIAGESVVANLAKMPHLLVAGATGAGKSVGLNAMLISLLYKTSPNALKLILIDPKMLELSVYEHIPHLLTPVVTDMKDAVSALRWCVVEMDRRYKLMAHLKVRHLMGYNKKMLAMEAKGEHLTHPFADALGGGAESVEVISELPHIVVIIDEFADLFMLVGKKIEELITRIAQKARAAGIHLILATQRPSVDVITGLIKANIPARIAFQVSSRIDSRTIIDQGGAEQLLGQGDMLYLSVGSSLPIRVHGAYVSDEEVHRVVDYLRKQGTPNYVDAVTQCSDDAGQGEVGGDPGEGDDLYDAVVLWITQTRKVSISSVQRRFKIGYNRAARIVESMEMAGVVGPMSQNGGREVLAPEPIED